MACSSSSSPGGTGQGDSGGGGHVDAHSDTGKIVGDAGHADTGKKTDARSDSHTGGGDAGHVDAEVGKEAGHGDTGHGGTDAGKDAGPKGPEQMLVTYSDTNGMNSELVVVNVATKAIEGRLPFKGSGLTDARNTTALFLLEQGSDLVARLDSTSPWKVDASWPTSLTADRIDGSALLFQSQPIGVVVESGTQAYILRQDRNDIAVIDESVNGEAGVPMTPISLAGLTMPGDPDGVVEVTAGAYVASTKRLYLVLGNINQNASMGAANPVCTTGLASTVVAIDTTTNMIVSLGGTGPKGSVPLKYYAPTNMVYDATGNRLIIVSAGCNATGGTATNRGIEAFDLTMNKSTSLLNLGTSPEGMMFNDIVTSFVYMDATHAVLGFDGTGNGVYAWNPTMPTVGANIPNAPDVFTYDGMGHLLGTRVDTDGGTKTDLVSVAIATSASTLIASNATTLTGSIYVASVDVWPHP